jgi:uncharacterized protein YbjT (DUF2867 family)
MYLVVGATGNVGSALVEQLQRSGSDVRAIVRDLSRAGALPERVETVVGDLSDRDSVASAVRGVQAVFYMQSTPGTAHTENMIAAAREARVQRIVVLSSIGARLAPVNHPIAADLAAREALWVDADLDVTFLRPNAFMSNALWWLPSIRDEGRVVDATDPGLIPCVDPDDVARVAAVTLTEPGHGGHGYILNGPEALSAREQVEILADVLGREIAFVPVTPDELARGMIEQGIAPARADAVRQLSEVFRAGRCAVLADDITNLTGLTPTTFREWCVKHADEFR